jgi:hypothetical protein
MIDHVVDPGHDLDEDQDQEEVPDQDQEIETTTYKSAMKQTFNNGFHMN